MIYGIINLHNHIYFFRYFDVFTITSFISINSVDTWYLNSLIIIVVSTSLNEQ